MMYQDFLELLRVFEEHKVRYMVIGGYAVGIHAEPRYTKDLDILIEPSLLNAKRVLKALTEFGAPTENLNVEELSKPGLLYVFGIPPLRVDIMNRAKGADAARMIKRSKKIKIKNTVLKVASLEDLIALKKAAGRAQDKADLEKLQAVLPRGRGKAERRSAKS